MVKILRVLLVVLICFVFTGCTSNKASIRIHYPNRSECILICSSEEELQSRIQKIEITKDNWDDYFSDYNVYNYNDVKDEAGNTITKKSYTFGFGLKFPIMAFYDHVSLKFDEIRAYEADVIHDKEEKDVQYKLYSANSHVYKVVNRNGDLCDTVEIPASQVKDCYEITLQNSERNPSLQVDKANCLEASGSIYLIECSGIGYHGDKVTTIRFEGKDTSIDMSVDYLRQLYENK